TDGDEAIVIARRTRCPVAVDPARAAAVAALVEHGKCDVVISDDGLQHYGLARDIALAVVDGVRRLGNGRLLPAGPLREPPQRLREVDFVVTNGIAGRGEFAMKYVPVNPINLVDRRQSIDFSDLQSTQVHAVCGIGNPERFFQMLKNKGLRIVPHAFPDHHRFKAEDLAFGDDCPILMTEKDAVKCEQFGLARCWSVPVTAELPEVFAQRLQALLMRGDDGQEAA
ncbi:MAG: tetraacyldisaccharide 4'-kinase, partial [Gammaproteobacteria bacterium]